MLWGGVVATVVGVAMMEADAILLLMLPLVPFCLMGVNHCSWRVEMAAALLAELDGRLLVVVVVLLLLPVPLLFAELLSVSIVVVVVAVLLAGTTRGEYSDDWDESLRVVTVLGGLPPLVLMTLPPLVYVFDASPRGRGETTTMVLRPRPLRLIFIPPSLALVLLMLVEMEAVSGREV